MNILNTHKDDRPKKGAWAPGWYTNICGNCKSEMLSDKRAISCADCAYGTAKKVVK